MEHNNYKKIAITCSDNFTLIGNLYAPVNNIKATIMIGPATGIKKEFYHNFACYLANNNYAVLTYDNRGIGESKQGCINKINASLVNWGTLDMTAVLEQLKKLFPNTTYHLIGHSAGAQLAGLMENANDLTSMCNFGASSGSLKYAKYPYKIKAHIWLNCYIPICNILFGQTKSHWVGMGEPLPKVVGQQWRKWCNGIGYIEPDLDTKIKNHNYNKITIPSLWLHAKDDDIANYEHVKDMVRVYSKIKAKILTLDPAKLNCEEIGHMKFFSRKNKQLWHMVTDWLEQYSV